MATRPLNRWDEPQRIPFYRNVKIIGYLAQIVFAVVVLVGAFILYQNVTSALDRSNLPADFGFLDNRAGIPIAETPIPYTPNDTYARAFLVGVVNTLKVALIGVVLAMLLGVTIGVMRLSNNWLLRQIATIYVETIRNTPLAVQIIFWFSGIITPLLPRVQNSFEVPGGALLSNLGFSFPYIYPTYTARSWWPWLVVALLVFIALFIFRRWQIVRSDRPGNPWPLPLGAFLLVAVGSYLLVNAGSSLPENVAVDASYDRGRATVFLDENSDGEQDRSEDTLGFALTTLEIKHGVLVLPTQDLIESRNYVYSTFRFPPVEPHEYESVEVSFVDPAAAEGLELHFIEYPTHGLVYRDLNNDGDFDKGEELKADSDVREGYNARVKLVFENFSRRLVANRSGQINFPIFVAELSEQEAVQEEESAAEQATSNVSPASLFAAAGSSEADEGTKLEANVVVREEGPLVISYPSIPISTFFGGITLSSSYLALLLALVIYTASFIAEIVRGGIQAVPKGQSEAANALGLSGYQTFTLIIFPQAMRIILPPMISQFLNLTKNSSLAPLAAYAELFVIAIIIANQTGASVPATIMIIVSYVVISLIFALILNIVNNRIALVER